MLLNKGEINMNPILNMKRRIGLGLIWLPGIGLPLTCLELFGNKEIADEFSQKMQAKLGVPVSAECE